MQLPTARWHARVEWLRGMAVLLRRYATTTPLLPPTHPLPPVGLAVVAAALKVGPLWALQQIVPVQEVVGCWVRSDLRRRVLQAHQHAAHDSTRMCVVLARSGRASHLLHRQEPLLPCSPTLRMALYSFCSRLMHALVPMMAAVTQHKGGASLQEAETCGAATSAAAAATRRRLWAGCRAGPDAGRVHWLALVPAGGLAGRVKGERRLLACRRPSGGCW